MGGGEGETGQQSRLGHTGYLKDPLLGDELYAQARQYRPGSGRFTSRDEWAGDINSPLSLNKYLYGMGNPGSYIDPDGRTAELMAAQEELAAFRTRGLTGLTAAKMGVMEAPWYQKPGMLFFGAVDVAQTIVGGGLEGVAAGSNLAANTLIVAAGEMGAKDASLFAPAYEQSAGELYGDLGFDIPSRGRGARRSGRCRYRSNFGAPLKLLRRRCLKTTRFTGRNCTTVFKPARLSFAMLRNEWWQRLVRLYLKWRCLRRLLSRRRTGRWRRRGR